MRHGLLLLAIAPLVLGACVRPVDDRPRAAPACVKLANTFYLIADRMNQGVPRAEQIALAERATRSRSAGARRSHWLRVIEMVYRFPDGQAEEIGLTVLDRCRVDERGRVVVEAIWPG